MTLLIAFLLLHLTGAGVGMYYLAVALWIFHLTYHAKKGE